MGRIDPPLFPSDRTMTDESASKGENAPRHVPITEERLRIAKENVETGRVRVTRNVSREEVMVREILAGVRYRVERVPVDRIVASVPPVRDELDRMVVPVTEEVLVKRFRVVEEIHLIPERTETPVEEQVTLRRTDVTVERL